MSLMRVFSGSCLSLDEHDYLRELHPEALLLGPGVDYFDQDGAPAQPRPSGSSMHKVFSGSALDLNEMGMLDDEAQTPSSEGSKPSTIIGMLSPEGADKEREKQIRSATTVVVIGASSFLGGHVVAQLLEAGYYVRAGVADASNQYHLRELYSIAPSANRRLTIIEVDVANHNAYRDAIRGCKYVIHLGSTNRGKLGGADEVDTIQAHLDSVKALFDAVRTFGRSSVKRVILTGSAAAVAGTGDTAPSSGAFNEDCWNKAASPASEPFQYAKVAFEREAWRLKEMVGVELTVLLPSIVIGPSKTMEVSEAYRLIQDLAGSNDRFPFVPGMYWNFVDVRDVATAHLLAMENPTAKNQRFIVTSRLLSLSEVGAIVRTTHPHLRPPVMTAPTLLTLIIAPLTHSRVTFKHVWNSLGRKVKLDGSKATRDLHLKLTPIEDTMKDVVADMIASGGLPNKDQPVAPPSNGSFIVFGLLAVTAVGAALVWTRRRK